MSERHHVKIDGNALRAIITDPLRVGRTGPDYLFYWVTELFKGVLQSGIPIKDWIPTILGNKCWDQRDPQSRAIQEALRNAHEMYSRTRKAPAYLPRNQNIRNAWGPLNAAGSRLSSGNWLRPTCSLGRWSFPVSVSKFPRWVLLAMLGPV